MSGWRIREAQEGDLDAISTMVAGLNAEEDVRRGEAADAAALRAAFLGAAPTGRLLVAQGAAGPVGYLTLHVTFETEFAARGCYMGDLYVMPAARRRGAARALVAAAARLVRAEGGNHIWWTALPKNLAGQAFYRALGAEPECIFAFALARKAFDRLAEGGAP